MSMAISSTDPDSGYFAQASCSFGLTELSIAVMGMNAAPTVRARLWPNRMSRPPSRQPYSRNKDAELISLEELEQPANLSYSLALGSRLEYICQRKQRGSV